MADEANHNISNANASLEDQNREETSNEATNTTTEQTSDPDENDVIYAALESEADAFTRFIERQRMDLMFELRRLRLGDRPVTLQSNRERIETFVNNAEERRRAARVPATREPTPSAHRADIDALISHRRVTSALGSAAFRRDLENTIRHTISSRPAASTSSVQTENPTPVATPIPEPMPVVVSTPAPTRTAPQENNVTPQISVRRILELQERESELNAWEAIGQVQRERIVMEISDLVHRQLVTTALESDFRQHLERNVLYRLERGSPNSDDIPEVTQTVAASIPRPVPQAASRPVPQASVATPLIQPNNTTVTNARSNRTSLADLDVLTSRLDSMQQMIQLMYTMQLDMQRSLRQEVASALSSSTNIVPNLGQEPVDAGRCTVCLTESADTVLYRCGHLCVCYTCGLQLREGATVQIRKCPVCRAPIDDIVRVYRSSRDIL